MSTYLKNMVGYKQSQLKNKSFAKIQKLFDKAMTRVNMFIDKDTELVKESSNKVEAEMAHKSSSKRAREELEQEIVQDDEVAIDAIPLATKPAPIVNFQIHRKGRNGYYEIMRADGSAKTYLLFSQLLKEFDREDLENLWKLVKAKHGNTRPEEGYERVLWGDLKTMFEHHVEDLIWRNLQGKKVLLWRLYDSCGIHFVRFEDMHVYMLVEKRYPLTPATITDMLNKKLQADYWNEMCYQLLKLMTKQLKKQSILLGSTQTRQAEQVCLSEGDIYDDPSLLRFYQNDDTSPWGNSKRKEKGEGGPEWIVRSKFEDELANFMLKKKSQAKRIRDMLVQHHKELREQYSQILSTINKSETPKPEAPTFTITTRLGISTQDSPFPAPPRPATDNFTEGETEKEGPEGVEPNIIQEPAPRPSILYQPSKTSNPPFPSRLKIL
ncbi:hypothetical protein Tco_0524972 [Tanacetum coccineum]